MQAKSSSFSSSLIQLNLAILFISTSGVLGRYIEMPTAMTIGSRALLAAVILYAFCKWKGFDFNIASKDRKIILLGGLLMGGHWLSYFYALQISNIAIGLLSLFTFPVITAILEPLILKTKILKFHLVLCATVLLGVYLLVPEFDAQNDSFIAVCFGVLSALCYSLRNILMKSRIDQYNGSVLMVYQAFIVGVVLSPFFFLLDGSSIMEYLPAIFLLALLTTAIGHTLFLNSLKHFSAVSASLISCLQPVYGIILGIIFLQEYPALMTIVGGAIILFSVVAESVRVLRSEGER